MLLRICGNPGNIDDVGWWFRSLWLWGWCVELGVGVEVYSLGFWGSEYGNVGT